MQCPECSTNNSTGAKFCMNCGTSLQDRLCRSCRSPLVSGARFCSECGQPTELQSPQDSAFRARLGEHAPNELSTKAQKYRNLSGERRVVTSVFADVVGSTALAEQLDPEDWTAIMNAAFERITASIYKYEGTIARLMGDALLAFFGAPISHEDDPERAVHAGLDLLAEVRDFAVQMRSTHDIAFQMRVGINTGDVVVGEVGSDLAYEYTAMGDAVNLAARMEQTALPGTVQISEHTYKLVAPLFDVEALGTIQVKGKQKAVRAYRVLGAKAAPGPKRGIEGLHSVVVGRERELTKLIEIIEATRGGRGHIVILIGEAGMGKSRLVDEMIQQWQKYSNISLDLGVFRGVSYETERPYGLFGRWLLDTAGVREAEPREAILNAMLSRAGSDAGSAEVYQKFAQAVKGLFRFVTDDQLSKTIQGSQAFKDELYDGILGFMRHRAERTPTMLVFDDLHWADPASVELVERMLTFADEYPSTLVFATRPEHATAGWRLIQTAEREFPHRYEKIQLTRLTDADSQQLVANLLNLINLPQAARDAINAKAEGNPFYIEEILRSLLELGSIVQENGFFRWNERGPTTTIELPDNINALITARIDRLDSGARRNLQYAAVIGRQFSKFLLKKISDQPESVSKELNAFERLGLIVPAGSPDRFSFRHDLTRDAAYGSILRKQRPELHRQVAAALEETYATQLVEQAPLLANHYALAGDDRKGLEHALVAGKESARIHAVAEAIHFFTQALEHSRKLAAPLNEQGPIVTRLGRSLELASRFEEAFGVYDSLDRSALEAGEAKWRLEAILGKATLRVIANTYYDPVEGKSLLERASELAEELGDQAARAKILWQLLLLDVSTGTDDQARLRYGENGLALARSEGLEELSAFILHDLWYAYGGSGQWKKAVETLQEACEIWQKLGNKPMLSESLLRLSLSYQAQGQDDLAIRYSNEAFENGIQSDNADQKAISRSLIGVVHVERGEWMRAIEVMEESIAYGRPVTNVTACIGTRSDLALLYLELGQIQGAETLLEEAFEVDFELLKPFAQSALIEVLIQKDDLENATRVETLLPSSTEHKKKLGAMTPLWVRAGLAHTKLALAREQWAAAARQAQELIENLETDGLHWLLAEVIYLKGLAHMAEPEGLDTAEQVLRTARDEAQRQRSKRTLWKILAAIGDLARRKGDAKKAAEYREKAAGVLQYIIDGLEDEALRASFIKTPTVQAFYNSGSL